MRVDVVDLFGLHAGLRQRLADRARGPGPAGGRGDHVVGVIGLP